MNLNVHIFIRWFYINTKILERIMSTRVIATTVQYNEEAIKMLEMTLKSFYTENIQKDMSL